MRSRQAAPLVPAVIAWTASLGVAQGSATPKPDTTVEMKAFAREPPGTHAQADLSYVLTAGNSDSSSLGFKGHLTHRFRSHALGMELGGLRASSSSGERVAVGTPEDFALQTPEAAPTAENYYARGHYEYRARERLYCTGGVGWERSRYSGVEDRWVVEVGLGYAFLAGERTKLRAAMAATYTDERPSAGGTGRRSFAGVRLSWDGSLRLLASTTLQHSAILDQSLEDAAARRADAQLGLRVAMTRTLGLQLSWRVLFNNQPPLVGVPLLSPQGTASGVEVLVPYAKLDQGLSVSLVLNLAPPSGG